MNSYVVVAVKIVMSLNPYLEKENRRDLLQFCIKDIEVCDTFGPEHIWYPDIWSPSIGPNGPQKFGPPGQMVPNQFGPPGQMVPRIFCLFKGQAVMILKYGDQIGWGPFV